MGHRVQKTQPVNAAIAPTWAAISEMGAVEHWHPNVARAEVLTDNSSGVGASRRVEFQDGNSVIETVIEQADGSYTTMKMADSAPLHNAVVTIRAEPGADGQTDVTFTIDYEVKYGPVGWLLHQLVMKRMFGKVFGVALDGLRHHLETGERVADSVPARAPN